MSVYISDQKELRRFKPEELVWSATDLAYGDYTSKDEREVEVGLQGRSAAALWAHVYFIRQGADIARDHGAVVYGRKELGGTMPDGTAFWYPELDISLMSDARPYDMQRLHPLAVERLSLNGEHKTYHPAVYMNEFWHIKGRRVALAGDEPAVRLRMTRTPVSLYKLQMLLAFDHSFKLNEKLLDSDGGLGGVDSIKESLLTTNFYVLLATLLVSLLHTFFDFLAFKNDIQFWRKQDDLTGLSVRTIIVNAVSQSIILAYLWEQRSSVVILASSAAGLAIEVWKVFRALRVSWRWTRWRVPVPRFQDRASYEARTKDLDSQAMRYLSMVAVPLLLAYTAYAYLCVPFTSPGSFLLSTAVNFVYAFGFIMMTPQLFINYKLKSVAHMPWRVFIYKSLNTFIDDLFAFVIKMPWLHRVACFRDDAVFLVYLYQMWIYPVDKTRVNEFGQSFEAAAAEETAKSPRKRVRAARGQKLD